MEGRAKTEGNDLRHRALEILGAVVNKPRGPSGQLLTAERDETTSSGMPRGAVLAPGPLLPLLPATVPFRPYSVPQSQYRKACLAAEESGAVPLGGLGVEEVRVSQTPWAAYLAESSLFAP